MSRPRGRKKANGEQPPANDAAAEDQVVAAAVAEGLGEEAPAPRRGGEQPSDGLTPTQRAHAQGYAVGKAAGDPQHTYDEGSPEDLAYTAGWRQGQDENAGRIGQKPMPAPTHEPAHA